MVLTEEQRKEYKKNYYEANKEEIKIKHKKYRDANKEKKAIIDKKYQEANKERIKEYHNKYYQTEEGKKKHKIHGWKQSGVICDDFDKLYNYYINCWNCEECNIELIEGKCGANHKCLDHNHKTGDFRNVVCHTCNVKRGIIDNNIIKVSHAETNWKYKLKKFILS